MKIDLNYVLKNLDGTDAKDGEVAATIRKAAETALISDTAETKPAEKLTRYKLLQKITVQESPDLSIDELQTLKTAVSIYPTLVYGQILTYLEQ